MGYYIEEATRVIDDLRTRLAAVEAENERLTRKLEEAQRDSRVANQLSVEERGRRGRAESRVAELEGKLEVAEQLIEKGVEIMSPSQVGQWTGVRAWQESPLEAYSKSAAASAKDGGWSIDRGSDSERSLLAYHKGRRDASTAMAKGGGKDGLG